MILSTLENHLLCRREVRAPAFDLTCDVLCVGAGAAGCYAADAAAREGADVLLLEYGKNIGGMPVCGGVTGYYYGTRGGAYEADDEAREKDATFLARASWESRQIRLTARLQSSGVRLLCGVSPIGVYLEGNRVVGLLVFDGEREISVGGRITIDATSDGHLLRMLDVKAHYGRPEDGVPVPFTVRTQYLLDKSSYRSDNGDAGIVDQYDARAYSRAIVAAHASAAKHVEEGKRFLGVAFQTGVREGLHFEGEETLTCEPLLRGYTPERVLFYAYSDLDRHGFDRAVDEEFFQNWWVIAGLATVTVRIPVPMGAIVPKGHLGIVTAGRCLSCDTYVASAVRMNRDMFRMGECVGYAAAAAVREGVDFLDIDYAAFRERAERSGAFLGDAERRLGFDEMKANHLKKMESLGRATDPRYDALRLQDKLYIPVDFDRVDVLAALKTDAPGEGIFAAYLGKGGVDAERLYAEMTATEDTQYRYHCAIALGLLGDRRAVPTLTEIVRERDCFFFTACRRSNQFRTAVAVCLLGRLGTEAEVPLLLSLLEDEEFDRPMYHTLAPNYLYYEKSDRNFVYFDVTTHTVASLIKLYRREGLPMEALRARLVAFLDGPFLPRVSNGVERSSARDEAERFVALIKKRME